mmetsp:Transcript_10811/g.28372  ORF Transcript_10811/g.28372 Transcript_10811/m.28372 type:complete len:1467 (-) Transcript_10811:2000-6400(-)
MSVAEDVLSSLLQRATTLRLKQEAHRKWLDCQALTSDFSSDEKSVEQTAVKGSSSAPAPKQACIEHVEDIRRAVSELSASFRETLSRLLSRKERLDRENKVLRQKLEATQSELSKAGADEEKTILHQSNEYTRRHSISNQVEVFATFSADGRSVAEDVVDVVSATIDAVDLVELTEEKARQLTRMWKSRVTIAKEQVSRAEVLSQSLVVALRHSEIALEEARTVRSPSVRPSPSNSPTTTHTDASEEESSDQISRVCTHALSCLDNVVFGEGRLLSGQIDAILLSYLKGDERVHGDSTFRATFIVTASVTGQTEVLLSILLAAFCKPSLPPFHPSSINQYSTRSDLPQQMKDQLVRHSSALILSEWVRNNYIHWPLQAKKTYRNFVEEGSTSGVFRYENLVLDTSDAPDALPMTYVLSAALRAVDGKADTLLDSTADEDDGTSASSFLLTQCAFEDVVISLARADSHIYCKIESQEFVGCAWSSKEKTQRSPHLLNSIKFFNFVSAQVASEVVMPIRLKERRKNLIFFIRMCSALFSSGHYNMCMAVMAGLGNAGVARLRYTWEGLESAMENDYNKVSSAMASSANYSRYRQYLARHNEHTPCVPYLGVVLTDLTFLADGNKVVKDDGEVNFERLRKELTMIRAILVFQQGDLLKALFEHLDEPTSPSSAKKTGAEERREALYKWLGTARSPPMTEEELYTESLKREPRKATEKEVAKAEKEALSSSSYTSWLASPTYSPHQNRSPVECDESRKGKDPRNRASYAISLRSSKSEETRDSPSVSLANVPLPDPFEQNAQQRFGLPDSEELQTESAAECISGASAPPFVGSLYLFNRWVVFEVKAFGISIARRWRLSTVKVVEEGVEEEDNTEAPREAGYLRLATPRGEELFRRIGDVAFPSLLYKRWKEIWSEQGEESRHALHRDDDEDEAGKAVWFVTDSEWRRFLSLISVQDFPPHSMLFSPLDRMDEMIHIQEGRVALYDVRGQRESGVGKEGIVTSGLSFHGVALHEKRRGDVLCMHSFCDGGVETVKALTREEGCRLYLIQREDIRFVPATSIPFFSSFYLHIAKVLLVRLRGKRDEMAKKSGWGGSSSRIDSPSSPLSAGKARRARFRGRTLSDMSCPTVREGVIVEGGKKTEVGRKFDIPLPLLSLFSCSISFFDEGSLQKGKIFFTPYFLLLKCQRSGVKIKVSVGLKDVITISKGVPVEILKDGWGGKQQNGLTSSDKKKLCRLGVTLRCISRIFIFSFDREGDMEGGLRALIHSWQNVHPTFEREITAGMLRAPSERLSPLLQGGTKEIASLDHASLDWIPMLGSAVVSYPKGTQFSASTTSKPLLITEGVVRVGVDEDAGSALAGQANAKEDDALTSGATGVVLVPGDIVCPELCLDQTARMTRSKREYNEDIAVAVTAVKVREINLKLASSLQGGPYLLLSFWSFFCCYLSTKVREGSSADDKTRHPTPARSLVY